MENEATTDKGTPCNDTQKRLAAAQDFARDQYEKIRRATIAQMENVRHYTEDMRQHLNEGWDVTCNRARDMHKAGEEYVKENPTGSMLGALGVGIILGLILGSRR